LPRKNKGKRWPQPAQSVALPSLLDPASSPIPWRELSNSSVVRLWRKWARARLVNGAFSIPFRVEQLQSQTFAGSADRGQQRRLAAGVIAGQYLGLIPG
jgi:hypothetical protein